MAAVATTATNHLTGPDRYGTYIAVLIDPTIKGARRDRVLKAARAGGDIGTDGHFVRVVEYDVPDRDGNGTGELIVLLTTILDPADATAEELADGYHQRWEQETANDQLRRDQMLRRRRITRAGRTFCGSECHSRPVSSMVTATGQATTHRTTAVPLSAIASTGAVGASRYRADVPSIDHEALVELFRQEPGLAIRLLASVPGITLHTHTETTLGSTNLTQTCPPNTAPTPSSPSVTPPAPTSSESSWKSSSPATPPNTESWPAYVLSLRTRLRCPVVLLVICRNDVTARWCAVPIEVSPGFALTPVVLGPQ